MDDYIVNGEECKISVRKSAMNNLLLIIVVMVVWFLLQAVILPKFGVKT
jgi:hypothetical protein